MTAPVVPTLSDLPTNYIGDHADRMEALVRSRLKRPRILAAVRAVAHMIQTFEKEKFDLILAQYIDNAHGAFLDQWGALVGEPREGLGDEPYRRIIKGKFLSVVSRSDENRIIELAQALTSPSIVESRSLPKRTLSVAIFRDAYMPTAYARRVARILRLNRPRGYAMEITEAVTTHAGFLERTAEPTALGWGSGLLARAL